MSEAQHVKWRAQLGQTGALLLYAALTLWGCASVWFVLSDLRESQLALTHAQENLAQIEKRLQGGDLSSPLGGGQMQGELERGAAFLGGEKLTLAAAEFQKRVGAAIASAGGVVFSSQLDRGATKGQVVELDLTVECETPQAGVQGLLYDLEAGRPFTFVESLSIRTRPDGAQGTGDPRLRMTLRLSALWREVEP